MTRTTRIPLAEFARREGKSYQTIRDKVARGSIKGEKVKGTWFVIVEDSIQVDDPQNTQSPELKAPDKPFGDMIFQALSALKAMEATRSGEVERFQDQLAQFHRDRMEEVKRLQDQLQAKDQAHLEATGRIQDQLDQAHQAHREEVERLHAQTQATHQSHGRRVAVLSILALAMVGAVVVFGWWSHQTMTAQQVRAFESMTATHAQTIERERLEVGNLRQDLTDARNQAENLRRDLEATQSTLEGLKATNGANLEP